MTIDDVRYRFACDRWATDKVLHRIDGIDERVWSASGVFDERGLGGILINHLGATQRWRHGLIEDGLRPRPEQEPLRTPAALRAACAAEWPRSKPGWRRSTTPDWRARMRA
jgi:hypothetical protein